VRYYQVPVVFSFGSGPVAERVTRESQSAWRQHDRLEQHRRFSRTLKQRVDVIATNRSLLGHARGGVSTRVPTEVRQTVEKPPARCFRGASAKPIVQGTI
jgi:hypothetical protein